MSRHGTFTELYPKDRTERLASLGAEVLDAPPRGSFDLAILPVHCPERFLGEARYKKAITHHQAVGELARFRYPIIEVTGVHGKTSACHILSHVLSRSGKRVLLLSSRGVYSVEDSVLTVLRERSSIAPSSILELSRMEGGYDCGVFEVSLGGTGLASVSVVTALGDNYKIAGGTKDAYDGKSQMIRSAKSSVVFPKEEESIWAPLVGSNVKVTTFGDGGDVTVSFPRSRLGKELDMKMKIKGSEHDVQLPGSFLAPAYSTAFASSVAAAIAFGSSEKDVVSSLKSFDGVPGRGEVTKVGEGYLVMDRNPGVSSSSIGWDLHVLHDHYGENDIGVVIDPVSPKVCEKLDLSAIKGVLSRSSNIVKGSYMIVRPGWTSPPAPIEPISDITDVRGKHKVVLWCVKEGYI